MNTEKNITVIGATGNLGAPVVRYLVKAGFTVTAVVRNEALAARLFAGPGAVRIVAADLQDTAALRAALKDTSYLYLNLNTETLDLDCPFAAEREGMANILAAVNRDVLRQILVISGLGAYGKVQVPGKQDFVPNIIRRQGHRLLKDSGIPYTILHCSWFADSFVLFRRKGTYSVIGRTDSPVYFTNCADFSRHLIAAVGNPQAMHREFPIQGKEGFLHPEAAKAFFAVYDPATKVSPLPLSVIRMMAFFNPQMKFLAHMATYFGKQEESLIADSCGTWEILGEPEYSPEAYARKLKEEAFYAFLPAKD